MNARRVHVMGPKEGGPILMSERECTEAAPFDAATMGEQVVFHPLARPAPGTPGFFCPACGEHSAPAAEA